MQFFTEAIDIFKNIVTGLGAGGIIFGFITMFKGYSSGNGAEEAKGWLGIVGGIGTIIIALTLIPKLKEVFNFNTTSAIIDFFTRVI